MASDTEYEQVEAEVGEPYWKWDRTDTWYGIEFVREIGEHPEFLLGKGKKAKPAKVWLITHMGKDYQLSLGSVRLVDALDQAKAKLGTLIGKPIDVMAKGDEKERTYAVRWKKSAQQNLAAATSEA